MHVTPRPNFVREIGLFDASEAMSAHDTEARIENRYQSGIFAQEESIRSEGLGKRDHERPSALSFQSSAPQKLKVT